METTIRCAYACTSCLTDHFPSGSFTNVANNHKHVPITSKTPTSRSPSRRLADSKAH